MIVLPGFATLVIVYFENCSKCKNLKMLSLYNTNFTDCRMLLKLPKLEEVDLRFCPLEHEEVLQTLDIRQVGLAKEQQ